VTNETDTAPYMGTKSDKPPLLSRREFIRNTVRLAVAGALIPGTLAQILPAIAPDALGGSGPGPVIRRDPTTNAKIPITLADMEGEVPVVVTAEWNFLPAVVYKVKKSVLEASSNKRAINTAQFALQHPTESDHAILVYDGKCKHLGCTIGFLDNKPASKDVADYDEDGFNDGGVLCPCHQGQYDIYNLALNVPATPPPAPLNVIEFDVKSWSDITGTSYADVIHGEAKYIQNAEHDAHAVGNYPATDAENAGFSTDKFGLRSPGWSA
jgi:Rieske Fe-S protein